MAGSNVFDAIIQAVDKATGPFRGIAQSMQGLVRAQQAVNAEGMKGAAAHAGFTAAVAGSTNAVAGALGSVTHAAASAAQAQHGAAHASEHAAAAHAHAFEVISGHVNLLRGHFGELRASIGEVGHSITEFLPMLSAIGAAGSLVGLFEMAEHTSESFAQLDAATARIGGITVPQLQALRTAATLTDVPIDSMQTGLLKLDKAIATAAAGKNKDVAALFHHLGIAMKDSHGHLLTVAEAMPKLADAFKNTVDPAMRVRMAMALFGRGGAEMLPMLIEGAEGLRKFADLSAQVNYAPPPEELEGLKQFHEGWLGLQLAVRGFTDAIGAKLGPVLAPVIEHFRDFVAANKEWISTAIADKVGELAHWLEKIDLHDVIESFRSWGRTASTLSDRLGGAHTAVGLLVLAIGSPLLAGVATATSALGSLSKVLLRIGAVAWANPMLLAIGGIAVATFILYWNWDKVSGAIRASVEAVERFAQAHPKLAGLAADLTVLATAIVGLKTAALAFGVLKAGIIGVRAAAVVAAAAINGIGTATTSAGGAVAVLAGSVGRLALQLTALGVGFAAAAGIEWGLEKLSKGVENAVFGKQRADDVERMREQGRHQFFSWFGLGGLFPAPQPEVPAAPAINLPRPEPGPAPAATNLPRPVAGPAPVVNVNPFQYSDVPPGVAMPNPYQTPSAFGPVPPLPDLYRERGPAGPGAGANAQGGVQAPQESNVRVQVDINNLPPGSRARAETDGPARTDINVGYANPLAYGPSGF